MEQKGAGDVAARRMEEAAWSSAMQKAEGKKVRVFQDCKEVETFVCKLCTIEILFDEKLVLCTILEILMDEM